VDAIKTHSFSCCSMVSCCPPTPASPRRNPPSSSRLLALLWPIFSPCPILSFHRLLFLLAAVEQEWQHIARYLGITEIVRLAATCTTLNRAMHALPPLGDRRLSVTGDASPDVHTIPDSRVPKEAVGAITAGWSRLRFAYTCRSSVSGTFWSAREKDFKQVRDAPSLCM
jgi:hypothetical protein